MLRYLIVISIYLISFASLAQKLPESYYRAQAAIDNKQLSLATQWIDSALMHNPKNHLIWLKKGEINYRSNRYELALESFQKTDSLRKGHTALWKARAYSMLGDNVNTFYELENHLKSVARESEANIKLDTAFSSIKTSEEWNKLWLNEWYNNNDLLIAEVEYLFFRNEWDYALDILNERMDGRRANHTLFFLRGKAYFNIGSYKAAEADFAHALNRSKRNHSYMLWQGKALIKLNKSNKAVRHLNRSIEQSGGEPDCYKYRAMAFASRSDYSNAISDIKHYLTFYPEDIDAISLLADYSIESGKMIDALLQLAKLIRFEPTQSKHLVKRAAIYMQTAKWEMAEIDLSKAITLGENSADAFLNRGICYFRLGENSLACADWKHALKLGSFNAQELIYKNCGK